MKRVDRMKLKIFKRLGVSLLAISLALSAPTVMQAEAKSPVNICSEQEWEVLKLVNKERTDKGLEPLSVTKSMQSAGKTRAKELFTYYSHTRPDGSSCFTALQGINYNLAGENIAVGYISPEEVMTGWMNSPGHKANILNGNFSHMGIGYYYNGSGYRHHWTQMFIGSCSPTSISVEKGNKTLSSKCGTTIEAMNRVLSVRCQHGTSYLPLTSKMCSKFNRSTSGTKKITVRYRGKSTSFQINLKGIDISKAKITNVKNKKYNGKAQTQKPKVTLKGKTLKKNRDYTISYKNNKKKGKATMIITGKGKYSGTVKKQFKITRK